MCAFHCSNFEMNFVWNFLWADKIYIFSLQSLNEDLTSGDDERAKSSFLREVSILWYQRGLNFACWHSTILYKVIF